MIWLEGTASSAFFLFLFFFLNLDYHQINRFTPALLLFSNTKLPGTHFQEQVFIMKQISLVFVAGSHVKVGHDGLIHQNASESAPLLLHRIVF